MVHPFDTSRAWSYFKLIIVAVTHLSLIVTNICAVFVLCYNGPWYLALPIGVLLGSPLLQGFYCAFNHLENRFRGELGLPLIEDDFMIHYTKLAKKLYNQLRRST